MKNPILLFNPRSIRAVGDSSLPMGLLMAASCIYNEFRIVVVDQRIERSWKQQVADFLDKGPLCVGITAMTGGQIKEGLRVSEMAKSKGCPVVWGGTHPSLLPEQTLSHPSIDYVIEGEGEESFAELAREFGRKESPEGIKGVWRKWDDQKSYGGPRAFVDLDRLPPIPYHLVHLNRYIRSSSFGRFLTLYTSRGCPRHCTFCYNQTLNKSIWRAMHPNRVKEEIRRVRGDHPEIAHIQFWDDNFFASLDRARQIAEDIGSLDTHVTWSVLGAHVRELIRMDEEYLDCLQSSGCKEMVVGIESGSQRIVDRIRKKFLLDELLVVNRRLGKYGIIPTYSFMSGFPEEEDEDIQKTVALMFRLKTENPQIVLGNIKPLICYPGTTLYNEALEQGFQPPAYLGAWSRFTWTNYPDIDIPWVDKKRRRQLMWMYYYTVLINPYYLFIRSRAFSLFVLFVRPFAQYRVKKNFLRVPLLAWCLHKLQRLLV